MDPKSEDISESVNSFDRGAIFVPRLDHDLSRKMDSLFRDICFRKISVRAQVFYDTKKLKIFDFFSVM